MRSGYGRYGTSKNANPKIVVNKMLIMAVFLLFSNLTIGPNQVETIIYSDLHLPEVR